MMRDNKPEPKREVKALKTEVSHNRNREIKQQKPLSYKKNKDTQENAHKYIKPISYGLIFMAVVASAFHFFTSNTSQQEKQISQQEKQEIRQQFNTAIAAGVTFPKIGKQHAYEIAEIANIQKSEKDKLKKAIAQEPQHFIKLTVWDTVDEDGDIVNISNGVNFDTNISLINAPQTLSVPIPQTSNGVTVTGARDGVGGITVGIQTDKKSLALPYLMPGEFVFIPASKRLQ